MRHELHECPNGDSNDGYPHSKAVSRANCATFNSTDYGPKCWTICSTNYETKRGADSGSDDFTIDDSQCKPQRFANDFAVSIRLSWSFC